MIDIEDVKTLSLKSGQMLVVQVDCTISTETKHRVIQMIEADAPILKGRLLVIDKTMKLAVVDAQQPYSAPASSPA